MTAAEGGFRGRICGLSMAAGGSLYIGVLRTPIYGEENALIFERNANEARMNYLLQRARSI